MKGVFNARIATLKSDIDGLQKDRESMLEEFRAREKRYGHRSRRRN